MNQLNSPIPIERARAAGLKWYFTGQRCPAGHLAKRSVSNRDCRACVDAKRAAKRKIDPERARAKDREKYWRNPERERALMKANRLKHIEKRRASALEYYLKNSDRAKARAREWMRANPAYLRYQSARRRAAILLAMPSWLTPEQRAEIRAIYASAKPGDEVDHIIPLRGKLVSGLHVPWNLQVISRPKNRAKGNRHAP